MYREVKQLSQYHTANKWQEWVFELRQAGSQGLNPILPLQMSGPTSHAMLQRASVPANLKFRSVSAKGKETAHHCLVLSDLASLSMSAQPPDT